MSSQNSLHCNEIQHFECAEIISHLDKDYETLLHEEARLMDALKCLQQEEESLRFAIEVHDQTVGNSKAQTATARLLAGEDAAIQRLHDALMGDDSSEDESEFGSEKNP